MTPLILLAGVALVVNVVMLALRMRATRMMNDDPHTDEGVRRHRGQVAMCGAILLVFVAVKLLGQD